MDQAAVPWDDTLDQLLIELVETYSFDFEKASSELRKSIELEKNGIKLKTSTRHRAKEFVVDACRLRFFELDQAKEMEENKSESASEENEQLPETVLVVETKPKSQQQQQQKKNKVVKFAVAEDQGGDPTQTQTQTQTTHAVNINLSLDASMESMLSNLDLSEISNQEPDGSSELGQVIQMLEQEPSTVAPSIEFQQFSESLAQLNLIMEETAKAHIALGYDNKNDIEKKNDSIEKKPEKPPQAPPPQPATRLGLQMKSYSSSFLSTTKGTRDEVYAFTDYNSEDDADDDDGDWMETRNQMKNLAARQR